MRKRVGQVKVQWINDELIGRWTQVATAYTAGATSIVLDDTSHITTGHIIQNTTTGEQMLVTAVDNGTNTLTVVPAFGETASAAGTVDDFIVTIGSAIQEGAPAPNMNMPPENAEFNYTQIFRDPFGITGTEDATQLFGGRDRNYLRMKKGIEHAVYIEMALWFGERNEDLSGTHPRRTLRGVDRWITTNRTDIGGTLTEAEFEFFTESAFRYGSSRKVAFCGFRAMSVINQFAAGKLETTDRTKTFGVQIMKYLTGHGELSLVRHPLFENDFSGRIYVLDMEDIALRPLRDTVLRRDIQANEDDEVKDEYLTELSLEVGHEKKHAVLTGITG